MFGFGEVDGSEGVGLRDVMIVDEGGKRRARNIGWGVTAAREELPASD